MISNSTNRIDRLTWPPYTDARLMGCVERGQNVSCCENKEDSLKKLENTSLFLFGGELMSKTVRVNIAVSPEVHEYYKEIAERSGLSMSSYMSFILFNHMNSEKENKTKE